MNIAVNARPLTLAFLILSALTGCEQGNNCSDVFFGQAFPKEPEPFANLFPFTHHEFVEQGIMVYPEDPANGDVPGCLMIVGPYGPHFGPFTGHRGGKRAHDFKCFPEPDMSSMTDLGNDVYGFATAEMEAMLQRIPSYAAPGDNFKIHDVSVTEDGSGNYYGSHLHWIIWGSYSTPGNPEVSLHYGMGHLGSIGKDLRDAMVTAGYIDPYLIENDTGSHEDLLGPNLIDGSQEIILNAGDTIAFPQFHAWEIDGHPGYWNLGQDRRLPFAQVEFWLEEESVPCGYDAEMGSWMARIPLEEQSKLQQMILANANNLVETSAGRVIFHNEITAYTKWLWQGETRLYPPAASWNGAAEDLWAFIGYWSEWDGQSTEFENILQDDFFLIIPITRTGVDGTDLTAESFFDNSLYEHPE